MDYVRLTTKNAKQFYVEDINILVKQLSPNAERLGLASLHEVLASSQMFVAIDGGKIIGMITLAHVKTLTTSKYWIEDLVVHEDARGKRVASGLMELVEEEARVITRRTGGHAAYIYLTSRPSREAAHALYTSRGYEKHDTQVFRLKL